MNQPTGSNPPDGLVKSSDSEVLASWIATQVDRDLGRQESSRNTSLLLVTFTEGIAAALVASALQLGHNHSLLVAASVLLAVGFLAIFFVLFRDRSVSIDLVGILSQDRLRGSIAENLSQESVAADLAAIRHNAMVVRAMRSATYVQALIAASASTLAVLAMLLPPA